MGNQTRVLALGIGAKEYADFIYKGEALIDSANLKPKGNVINYDCLICYNTINRVFYGDIQKYLQKCVDVLRPGGEMLLLFPSLEWIAEQVLLQEKPSPVINAILFGQELEPNRGAYTLMQVRGFCQQVGLKVTHAKTGIADIKKEQFELHTVRGIK